MMRSALIALGLLGCGKVIPAAPDAPDIDADPRGVAKVTVLDVVGNGALAANIPVIFHNPDGTIAAEVTTDSMGRAEATILPGSSVTAVWLQGMRYLVGTIVDIKPGDDLPIGFTGRDGTSNGTFQVTFTPLPTAGLQYDIYTPCGQTGATVGAPTTIMLRNDCRRDMFDIYVVASNAGVPTDYAQLQNVSLAAGSAAIPNTWSGVQSFSATYTNVPAEITTIGSDRFSGMRNGYSANASGTPMNNTLALQTDNVPIAGSRAFVRTTLGRADGHVQQITQRVAGNTVNYNLNAGMQLTPWLTTLAFDPTTLAITPTVEGSFTSTDLYGADLQYSREIGMPGMGMTLNIEWIVIGATPGVLHVPRVPESVGPVNPLPTDIVNAVAGVVVDSGSLEGWDAARAAGVFDLIDFGIEGTDTVDLVRSQLVFTRVTPRAAPATVFGGRAVSSSAAASSTRR